ncbi:MAG: hypothetical protein AAF617_11620, partial [Bacteroidota bacterium]
MKQLLFTLSCIFCFMANGQITQQQLSSVSVDSLKSGFRTYQTSNPEVAKEYLKALLHRTKNTEVLLRTDKIHFQLANMYRMLRKKDSALHHINKVLKLTENDEKTFADYLYVKGGIYYEFGAYTKAIEYYTKVYEIAKNNNDLLTQADVTNDIALIKTQIGQNADALQLVKKKLPFYEELIARPDGEKYKISYINSLMTISDIYTNLYIDTQKNSRNYLDSAQYYNTIAIDKSVQYEDDLGFAISLRLKGIIHHEEGKIEQSTTDLIKAEELIQNLHLPSRLLIVYLYRGKNYYVSGDYEKALSYFQKTETLIQETKADFPDLQELYILMAKSYEQKNDSENAITYFNLFHQKDAQNDNLSQQSLDKLYRKYDVVAFKDTIDALENDLEESNYTYSLILGGMLLLVLGISIYYKRQQLQNKKHFQQILAELELKKDKKSSAKKLHISQENVTKILKGLAAFEKNELFLKKNCSL